LFLKALLCYKVALLHTTSSKFWCVSRLLFVTKYYYQQHISQHPTQAKCTAVPIQIVEVSHRHAAWLLVDNKSKIPLLNHQNRNETTTSAHTRKRQHKRLRIASVSSNIRGSGSKQSLADISLTFTDNCARYRQMPPQKFKNERMDRDGGSWSNPCMLI